MSNLSDRILNGDKIYLSSKVTKFTTGFLKGFWMFSLLLSIFLAVLALVQLGAKGGDVTPVIMLLVLWERNNKPLLIYGLKHPECPASQEAQDL
jgi:hypothetical protein